MSRWPDVVPLLATRCLYWGVHLTTCQPDPNDNQMSRLPDVVPLLSTRCLYLGGSSEQCTPNCTCEADLTSDCKCQPDLM